MIEEESLFDNEEGLLMKKERFENLSFAAVFSSLCFILFYLALALESARGAGDFWLHSQRAAEVVASFSMKGLLLTVLLGLGLDWYMKKSQEYIKN